MGLLFVEAVLVTVAVWCAMVAAVRLDRGARAVKVERRAREWERVQALEREFGYEPSERWPR